MRTVWAVLAGLLCTAAAPAGEAGLENKWKISVYAPVGVELTPWLLKIADKDGKLSGQLTTAEGFGKTDLSEVRYAEKVLTVVLKIQDRPYAFRFQVPRANAKKLFGTVYVEGKTLPVQMAVAADDQVSMPKEAPDLSFEEARTIVEKKADSGKLFDALGVLIAGAKAEKVTPAKLVNWIETTRKAAANYGPDWRHEVSVKVLEQLAGQKEFANMALEIAKHVNAEMDDRGPAQLKLRGRQALVRALKAAGKSAEAGAAQRELLPLEEAAHAEHARTALDFEVKKYPGRQKGNRVVLVELFTGAECPPCVAADLGFDGLERTYTDKEVILLQYHLHIPRPDALATPDTEARQDFYDNDIGGTPTILFNGKVAAGGGGGRQQAEGKYQAYRKVIEPLLEDETPVTLTARATRKGDKIKIDTTVEGLKKVGDKTKLRLVLVEEWVRYQGGNGLPYHHRVVRALPGGASGLALTKGLRPSVTFDLAALRKDVAKFLDRNNLEDPTAYRNLSVVAFVQEDGTREVLQAVEVPVK